MNHRIAREPMRWLALVGSADATSFKGGTSQKRAASVVNRPGRTTIGSGARARPAAHRVRFPQRSYSFRAGVTGARRWTSRPRAWTARSGGGRNRRRRRSRLTHRRVVASGKLERDVQDARDPHRHGKRLDSASSGGMTVGNDRGALDVDDRRPPGSAGLHSYPTFQPLAGCDGQRALNATSSAGRVSSRPRPKRTPGAGGRASARDRARPQRAPQAERAGRPPARAHALYGRRPGLTARAARGKRLAIVATHAVSAARVPGATGLRRPRRGAHRRARSLQFPASAPGDAECGDRTLRHGAVLPAHGFPSRARAITSRWISLVPS